MRRPLTRKLTVKEQLEQGASTCEILEVLADKGIRVSRMTMWRDIQEVQKYTKDELINNHEMGEIECLKSLRERQKMAVQAKNTWISTRY